MTSPIDLLTADELQDRLSEIAVAKSRLQREERDIEIRLGKIQAHCSHRRGDGTLALVFYARGGWGVVYYQCSLCHAHDYPCAEEGYEDYFSKTLRTEAQSIIVAPKDSK